MSCFGFSRGGSRTAGECPHLGRHNSEAAALFAGARGLDGGVQGQQVGLECDLRSMTRMISAIFCAER